MRYNAEIWADRFSRTTCIVLGVLLVGASMLALSVLFGGAGQFFGHDIKFYGITDMRLHLLTGALCVLPWVVLVVAVAKIPEAVRRFRNSAWFNICFVFLVAMSVRLVFLYFSGRGTVQFSDNQVAWNMATGHIYHDSYILWVPRWMNYVLILRWVSQLLETESAVVAMFGVVCSSVTAVAVFLLGRELSGNMFRARFAAVAYALFPSCIAYSAVCTPEHPAGMCFAGTFFCLVRMSRCETAGRSVAWAVAAGVLLGMGHSVKPLAPLFIGAFAVVQCFRLAGCAIRCWKMPLVLLVLVAGIQFVLSRGMIRLAEREFNVSLMDKQSSVHMFVVGLNRQGEGQIHLGDISRTVPRLMACGATFEEANHAGLRTLVNDWRGHASEIPSFFAKKAIWAWQDFNTPFLHLSWLHGGGDRTELTMPYVPKFMPAANQLLYVLLLLAAAVSVFVDGLANRLTTLRFVVLVVLGYFCVSMIIEGQSRYKYLVLPYLFVLASPVLRLSNFRCPTPYGTGNVSSLGAELAPNTKKG